jgi:hypothetical protein
VPAHLISTGRRVLVGHSPPATGVRSACPRLTAGAHSLPPLPPCSHAVAVFCACVLRQTPSLSTTMGIEANRLSSSRSPISASLALSSPSQCGTISLCSRRHKPLCPATGVVLPSSASTPHAVPRLRADVHC